MSAKPHTHYECSNCGHTERKWLGRCPSCGEWNTLSEVTIAAAGSSVSAGKSSKRSRVTPLPELAGDDAAHTYHSTGIAELDRVLGGGLVPGASILVGGEPGIGKSTLMLQMAAGVRRRSVLYVTGEESAHQVAARAKRLGLDGSSVDVVAESDVERILGILGTSRRDVVIVDSVQTLRSSEAGSVPGSPNQIKFGTFELSDWARERSATVFLVAHVTKEGSIAGPRTIEHMVDTVLYFEQSDDDTRFLRATKNRFGSTDEIGLFVMNARGLTQVSDPNRIFLVSRDGDLPAGVAIAPVIEGSRVILIEVQALTVPAKGGLSRVYSDRLDSRRVSRVAAVLEKHLGVQLSDHDIYVNVAGGMRISDVAVELPLAVALYSARSDRAIPTAVTIAGEVSLAGEVRPVAQMARRARTAREMGMKRCIGPASIREGEDRIAGLWSGVPTVSAAVEALYS